MKFNKHLIASAVALGLAAPMAAMATNGYFSHGYGTKNKALAGGGSALPQDAMAAATNPAGMVFVGDRMDLGAALFSPSPRSFTGGTPGGGALFAFAIGQKEESDNDIFLIPHFARNWMLDANSSVGVSVYGNGGMNTDYSATGGFNGIGIFNDGVAGVNLEQLFINTSYARKIDAKSSWGASAILAYQRFKAEGLAAFGPFGGGGFDISTDPANLSANGHDASTGFGIKLGWQGEVSSGLTLSASYQSEIAMSEFDNYAGLFAEQGDFDIPATWTLGLAYDIPTAGTFTFDVQEIMYSDIASIANPISPAFACYGGGDPSAATCLGGSQGPGFGWQDMTIYKLGYQWSTSPDMTWRVGVSSTDQPIPESEALFNVLAPGIMETHYTFGFTMNTGADSEFNFAAMYAPEVSVNGVNAFGDGQPVELEMSQYELEASWGWKF